ncbi:MAG: LPS biosynthesis protein WbpP [Anaerolinea sp.]|nr:LPS biosynthesis protein WbpP [Anaerolinea sp.]
MTSALVTGGAGFIGSHLVFSLLENGYQVKVLDNLSTGNQENLALFIDHVDFIHGDIRDKALVKSCLRGVDVVFHLAAQISVAESMQDPGGCFDINVTGTNTLLQCSAESGVKRMVISSSAAVYGDQGQLPIMEDTELRPLSPYAASKLMDETLAGMYSRSFNLPVTCLRYFNVYGPRQDPSSPYAAAIPIFIRQLLSGSNAILYGDGGQTRDFIYVADVARANILAAENGSAEGAVMNICTGQQISIMDLLTLLQQLIPGSHHVNKQPARLGDIYHSYGNPLRAKELISFEASVSFSEGLERTIEWMKK